MNFLKKILGIFKKNSKGQATVEYLLLIVVVIAIGLSIGRPLGNNIRDFANALVGKDGYYACLMKNGLLPGVQSDKKSGARSCGTHKTTSLTFLNDISAGTNSGGTSRGTSGKSTDSKNLADKLSKSDKGNNAKDKRSGSFRNKPGDASSSGGLSSGGESSSSGRLSQFPSGKKLKKKGTNKKIKARQKKRGGETLEEAQFTAEKKRKARTKAKIPVNRKGRGYLGHQIQAEEEEKERASVFKTTKEKSSGVDKEQRKKGGFALAKGVSTSDFDDKDKGFNLTGFFKVLLIAILIIFILVFIFSQFMEYQSRE